MSASLKGKGTPDAGEGTSTGRGKKKMKAPSPAAAAPPSTPSTTVPPAPQEMATLPDKPVSSSLNDTGTEDSDSDSDEGTLAARKRQLQAQIMEEKKMKNAPAPSPAPAKDVLSVDATGSLEGTCTWTIPHFCTMKVDKDGGKSSDIFSIGGHKWKLYVYPMGRDSGKDKFVSLYLQLADDTKKLPKGWQVPVFSTFSVICQHDPKKSHKEDGEDIFNAVDKTWGWNDFIPLLKFYDVDNGFLVNDTMIIKAKMEVKAPEPVPAPAPPKADVQNTKAASAAAPSPAPAKEVVSVNAARRLDNGGAYTWRIPNFSKLKVDGKGRKFSDVFSIGGHEWKLRIFPRGKGSGKDKSVSLALLLADDHGKVTADFSLSMICQRDPEKSHTKENTFKEFTCRAAKGYADFIPLTDFHDPANGFLVNDTVIIKAKIEVKAPAPAPAPAPPKADVKNTKAASASAPSPAPANWMVDVSVNAARRLDKWGAYTWRIPNFSKLKWIDYDRETSDTFSIGGHKWKLCVYLPTPPQGRSTRGQKSHEKNKSLSLSLVLADTDKLPKDGKVTANLCLSVTCQRDPEGSRKVETKNTFTAHFNSDHWEWNNIIPLTDLRDPKRGYLVKDTMIIEAKIDV